MTRHELRNEFLNKIKERKKLFKMTTTQSTKVDALLYNYNNEIMLDDLVEHVNVKGYLGRVTNVKGNIITVDWPNNKLLKDWHHSFLKAASQPSIKERY